ncbi:hypothetical protein [Chthonobacter rhizosphaerae]|uniref:hypothetical protein n=1 Tax=Chthonobacter rhizosphaerae TaxID=2735553 RepID=UPI0015EE65EE|nr:hypothetical protein [Chthonobacter rhizosphaerae]
MASLSETVRSAQLQWHAVWQPAFLALAPMIVTAAVWLPAIFSVFGLPPVAVLIAGLIFLLGRMAEERAPDIQMEAPKTAAERYTAILLRHRDETLDAQTKARFHAVLTARGFRLPSPQVEAAGTVQADRAYQEAAEWLMRRTRSLSEFPDLAARRSDYLQRLNLLALKPIGIIMAVAGVAINGWLVHRYFLFEGVEFWIALALAFVSFGALAIWKNAITGPMVEDASRAYAADLLGTCDTIAGGGSSRPSSMRYEWVAGVADH